MTMKLRSEREKVASESYQISYWKLDKETDTLTNLEYRQSDEIIKWR